MDLKKTLSFPMMFSYLIQNIWFGLHSILKVSIQNLKGYISFCVHSAYLYYWKHNFSFFILLCCLFFIAGLCDLFLGQNLFMCPSSEHFQHLIGALALMVLLGLDSERVNFSMASHSSSIRELSMMKVKLQLILG